MKIGNTIRELRKEKKLTQEQLAEKLHLSFQAVSKWENNISLPDISVIPSLASVLGVSVDRLFSEDIKEIDDDIAGICENAYKYRETDPDKSRVILEKGLEKYPENDILLNNLLYTVNYSENPDETIRIASKLIDRTDMSDVRYDALRFLAYAFNAKGDKESAVNALEQIPEIYFTKLSELSFILNGDEKYKAAEKQKWISFEILLQMLWKIAEYYEEKGETEKAISETEKALSFIEVLKNEEKIDNFHGYKEFFTKHINRMKKIAD